MYKILWIDDQWEELIDLKGSFLDENIKLIPFKSLNTGIEELKKNYNTYDGILLDGIFLENEHDEKGTEDSKNLYKAVAEIYSIPKKFEIFIFTGQPNLVANEEFKKIFPNTFYKGNSIKNLSEQIREAADSLPDKQIKNQYKDVFDMLTPELLGEKYVKTLLNILKKEDYEQENLNELRKIIESIFEKLGEYDIIPEQIIKSNGNINGSTRFLSGNHETYKWVKNSPINPFIMFLLKTNLEILQDASHNDTNKYKVDSYIKHSLNINYLYKSILNAVLEIITYLGNYLKNNKDKEINKNKWYEVQWINAIIMDIDDKRILLETENNAYVKFYMEKKIKKEEPYRVDEKLKISLKSNSFDLVDKIKR